MRPLELKLRNFRSYFGDDAAFDFRDRRLVGIVGPIGSGKSTILDAIAFALYGRTASVGKSTKALIHQRADNAAVAFRFTVDDEVWEAQRMLRQKGASQHALYRLADDTDDAEKLETVTGDVETTARIAELLGLDFDAFGRSVLLAQGRFAEFLSARPAERDKVLKGVFGHDRIDRMRTAAKEHARYAEIEAEKATVAVQHLAELEARTGERRRQLGDDHKRMQALEDIEPDVVKLGAAIDEARREEQRNEARLDELRAVAESLPGDDDLEATLSAARRAATTRREAAGRLEAARSELEQAQAGVEAARGARKAFEEATALFERAKDRADSVTKAAHALRRGTERLEQATAEMKGQADRVTLADRTADDAASALAEQTALVHAAEEAFHEATHANMAATLRNELHSGATCPVCEQTVATVPVGIDAADVDIARSALDEARTARGTLEQAHTEAAAALESARTAHQEAERRHQEAASAAEELERELRDANERSAEVADQLRVLVGSGDAAAAIAAMGKKVEAAAARLDEATAGRERAFADHDAAIESEQATGKHLADLRVTLAGISARLDGAPDVGEGADAIGQAAAELRRVVEQGRREAGEARDRAAATAKEHEVALDELLGEAGVTEPFDQALAALRSRVEVLGEEIAHAEEQLAGQSEARERRDQHVAAMKTYQALAGDLTDARFVRFLLDDERRRLAELGSDHFQRLSNGRYRFTEDGVFDIVDLTAADAVRKADSLSGGETFLASLGLALALAEIVSRGGGRLDSFFLDEGFGTLDPEHLDLAMEGIESLVAEGSERLVVVVSHVPELRHRIEDLIELDRSPTTGDTRVLSA